MNAASMRPTGPALAAMPLVLARPTCMGLWTLSHPFIDYFFALSIDVGSYVVRRRGVAFRPSLLSWACRRPLQSTRARPPSADAGSFVISVALGLSFALPVVVGSSDTAACYRNSQSEGIEKTRRRAIVRATPPLEDFVRDERSDEAAPRAAPAWRSPLARETGLGRHRVPT